MFPQDEIEFKAAMPRDNEDVFVRAAYWLVWDDRYGCPQGQSARKVIKCLRDLVTQTAENCK
jgi:hypothetical protein